jgi:hypothetical protein
MFRKRKYCDEEKYNDEDKLKKAVRNGDEKMVRRLVKGGVILNSKSRRDWVWKIDVYGLETFFDFKFNILSSGPFYWSRTNYRQLARYSRAHTNFAKSYICILANSKEISLKPH